MEGVKGLREAFNEVASPVYTCTMALMAYERVHDTEFQILTFRGRDADGTEFEIKSEMLRPSADLGAACRETAQRLLDARPVKAPD